MQPLKMLSLNVTAVGAWAVLVGLVWGIFGAILGFAQPLAWPVWYANGRWLLRTVIWAATFTVLVAIGLIAWRVAYPHGHLPFYAPSRVAIWLTAWPCPSSLRRSASCGASDPPEEVRSCPDSSHCCGQVCWF